MRRPPLTETRIASRRGPARWGLVLAACLAVCWSNGTDAGAGFQAPAGDTLKVASYNVQFVTPDLPLLSRLLREWPGHKPNVAERAEAIARHLACFDVIALQETINDARRREIFDRLESAGRDCGKPSRLPSGRMFALVEGPGVEGPEVEPGSWLPLVGNELALASRLPIVGGGARVYRHAAKEDALAAKGALHVRLARGDDLIDVFVSHLQAGSEHGGVRRAQIEELAAFIREAAAGTTGPVLVLGDFNIRGTLADRRDPASDYNFLRNTLNAATAPRGLVDAWLATHPDDPETASGTKPRVLADGTLRPQEERIDYVLVAGDDAVPRSLRRDFLPSDLMIDGEAVGHLSDHAALLAELSWRRSPAPARLAASGP